MDNNLNHLYIKYLQTPVQGFDGKVSRPIASATLTAMINENIKLGENIIARDLVNQHFLSGKKIKFWSDPHFFHENIIKYCDRPFKSAQHMNMMMCDNYVKEISDDDLVIWGGDISFGNKDKTRDLLKSLPGKKILIMGNHDFLKKKQFMNIGIFDATVLCLDYKQEIEGEQWDIWVTHYPINSNLIPKNTINIHGHIHTYTAGFKNLNISVEHTQYKPQEIDNRLIDLRLSILTNPSNHINTNQLNNKIRMDI